MEPAEPPSGTSQGYILPGTQRDRLNKVVFLIDTGFDCGGPNKPMEDSYSAAGVVWIAPLLTPLCAARTPLLASLMTTSAPLLTPLHPSSLGLSTSDTVGTGVGTAKPNAVANPRREKALRSRPPNIIGVGSLSSAILPASAPKGGKRARRAFQALRAAAADAKIIFDKRRRALPRDSLPLDPESKRQALMRDWSRWAIDRLIRRSKLELRALNAHLDFATERPEVDWFGQQRLSAAFHSSAPRIGVAAIGGNHNDWNVRPHGLRFG